MRRHLVVVLLTAMSLAACGDDSEAESPPPADGDTAEQGDGDGPVLTIEEFTFPDQLEVAAGVEVRVINRDSAAHTVSSMDGSFGLGNIDGNSEDSFTAPSDPGTYAYVCNIHPSMTGELIVG